MSAAVSVSTVPTYRRVVVPLDGSRFARTALQLGHELAGLFGARLELAGFGVEATDEAELRVHLEDAAGAEDADSIWSGVNWNAADGIAEVLAAGGPALVCMASHARSGFGAALLGSVSAELLARGDVPIVLTGPCYRPGHHLGTGRVMACVDGTSGSEAVLPLASTWAEGLGVGLEVVTVAEPVPPPPAGHPTHRHHGPGDDPEGYVERLAARWRTSEHTVQAHVIYDPVDVAAALADYAAAGDAGLVVVASRARRGLPRALLGSVAADIVASVTVPVLVAPRGHEHDG